MNRIFLAPAGAAFNLAAEEGLFMEGSMRRALIRAAAFVLALGWLPSDAAQAPRVPISPQLQSNVDLALVLAVDSSGSVDDDRFELQKQGYAKAFLDPKVLNAIRAGNEQAIAVSMMQWT